MIFNYKGEMGTVVKDWRSGSFCVLYGVSGFLRGFAIPIVSKES
jgi:hypothetical protein